MPPAATGATGNPPDVEPLRLTPTSRTALALIPTRAAGDLERVARESGLELHLVRDVEKLDPALQTPGGWSVVILSLGLPGVDMDFVRGLRRRLARTTDLVLTAPELSLERAVLAREVGSGHLLREPIEGHQLERALRDRPVVGQGAVLEDAPAPDRLAGLVGRSPALEEILGRLSEVGDTSSPVLLQGEAGTGKEMVARALHALGRRRHGLFVPVNCAALPEQLLESELFGHERGAVEGAVARRIGRIERAEGGTLFLEEVDGLSPILQARIHRIFTEYSIERVGGGRPVPVDVRVVASTDRDLDELVERGEFRGDLARRLQSVRIQIPPLRERAEDVVPLALHFAALFAERYARELEGITEEAVRLLEAHGWPGNVLELRNVMDRAVLRARGRWIDAGDLALDAAPPRLSPRSAADAGYPPTRSLADVERDHIRKVLHYTRGAMGQAADILGIHRNTLTRKVDQYGLREETNGGSGE